jgi:hypothetical protein
VLVPVLVSVAVSLFRLTVLVGISDVHFIPCAFLWCVETLTSRLRGREGREKEMKGEGRRGRGKGVEGRERGLEEVRVIKVTS